MPPSSTQAPMLVMNDCVVQRHSKSVVVQPALVAEESKQSIAQVGNCATRSGSVSDVEFVCAVARAAKKESATVVNCMMAMDVKVGLLDGGWIDDRRITIYILNMYVGFYLSLSLVGQPKS